MIRSQVSEEAQGVTRDDLADEQASSDPRP